MAKATDTWMPLYVADYLKDTTDLSAEEHGAYLLLLMRAWTSGGELPADDDRLRRITRMEPKSWKQSRSTILAFFRRDGDTYRHKRVDDELAKAASITDKRSGAGKAGAEARWRQTQCDDDDKPDGKRNGKRIANAMANPSQNDGPSPSPLTEPIPTQPLDPEPARADLPDGFDAVVLAAGLRITARNREREAAFVRDWVGIGLGLEEICSEIRGFLAEHEGVTSTLGRFDKRLRDLAARRSLPLEPAAESVSGRDDCPDGPDIRRAMVAEFGEKTYRSWLGPCDLRRDGEALIITAPTPFAADYIRNQMRDRVRVAVKARRVEVAAA